jgi:hypothetical protein
MIEIKAFDENGSKCYKLTEKGKCLCACFYNMEKAEITDLEEYGSHDDILNKAVIKAVLNSLDLKGTETVFCNKKEFGKLLTELGFKYDNEKETYILNLKGYFKKDNCKS